MLCSILSRDIGDGSQCHLDDDPHDWEMIDAGIELAKQYQANGMLSY